MASARYRGRGSRRSSLTSRSARCSRNRFADRDGWHQLAEGRHTRFTLEYNAQRLAVVDRDAQAVIATHIRDGKAPWLDLTDGRTWADLADAYEKVNPVAVLPVLRP